MRADVVGVLNEDDIGISTQERTSQYELWRIAKRGRLFSTKGMLRVRTSCFPTVFHLLPVGLDNDIRVRI